MANGIRGAYGEFVLRLDEWQRYIDSEFVEPAAQKAVEQRPLPGQAPATPALPPADAVTSAAELAADVEDAPETEVSANPAPFATELNPADTHDPEILAAPAQPAPEQRPERIYAVLNSQPAPPPTVEQRSPDLTDESPVPARPAERVSLNRSAGSEVDIPSFADYISPHRTTGPGPETPALEPEPANARQSVAEAPAGNAIGNADARQRVTEAPIRDDIRTAEPTVVAETPATAERAAPSELSPLRFAPRFSAALDVLESAEAPADDAAVRQRRSDLLRRLCDPIISANDASDLLGVSVAEIERRADSGSIARANAVAVEARGSGILAYADRRGLFRLSDIVQAIIDGPPDSNA